MRKLSIALTAAAGLALVAGAAAAPALAELRITLGQPNYSQPYYGSQQNYYGYNTYNTRPYYSPYYGTYNQGYGTYDQGYSTYNQGYGTYNQGYTTYTNPNYAPYSNRYQQTYYYNYPGYYGR